MATSSGRGLEPVLRGYWPWVSLFQLPDAASQDRDGYTIGRDFYFGGLPPDPVEIPYTWLRPPLTFRPDSPVNVAEVTRSGGTAAVARDHDSISEYGEWAARVTLDTATAADAANLADWLVAYYTDPRQRCPALAFALNSRTDDEVQRLLSCRLGTRIRVTDAPATWPAGATELIIEGIQHSIAADFRLLSWSTSPVIGESAGQAGPWFYLDQSFMDGTDVVPY